jgi:phosphoglycerate kinase
MGWKSLDDMDLNGKRVLLRVDINVPVENGQVSDATRIERIAPTVADILAKGGKPILLAHFGRPKGKVIPELSLRICLSELEKAFGQSVTLIETLEDAEGSALPDGIILLENIRFHEGEEGNDPKFAARIAALGDVFCNDAFSAAHRAHASTTSLAKLLPSCAGRLMQAELTALEAALSTPKRPVGAVVGGAKVSTKIDLLMNLVGKLDVLVIGGGMANTFLGAMGASLGNSLQEPDLHGTARDILKQAETTGCKVILPSDGRVSRAFAANAEYEMIKLNAETVLEDDQMILDAGDVATDTIVNEFKGLKTLIWNGPLGAFEIQPFDKATMAAAKAAAALTVSGDLITVAGGGDTVAALNLAGAADDFTYISTAGGAFLEWMEGKELPGVSALQD